MKLTNIKWFVSKKILIYFHKCINVYFIVHHYELIVGYLFSIIDKNLNLGIISTNDFFSNSVTGSLNKIFFSKIKENIRVFFLLVYNKIYFSIPNKMNIRIYFIYIYVFNLKMLRICI